jgi:hypothetical protein
MQHLPTNHDDFPVLNELTLGALVANRADMIRWAYFHGDKVMPYLVDRVTSLDIDYPDDLEVARALWPTFGDKSKS